jgi:CRP-like cAMP-binding protein
MNWPHPGPGQTQQQAANQHQNPHTPRRILISLTRQELASMCSLTRQTVSRTLSKFFSQG